MIKYLIKTLSKLWRINALGTIFSSKLFNLSNPTDARQSLISTFNSNSLNT